MTKLLNLPVLEWNKVERKANNCRTNTAKSTFDYIETWLVKCINYCLTVGKVVKNIGRQAVKNTPHN